MARCSAGGSSRATEPNITHNIPLPELELVYFIQEAYIDSQLVRVYVIPIIKAAPVSSVFREVARRDPQDKLSICPRFVLESLCC